MRLSAPQKRQTQGGDAGQHQQPPQCERRPELQNCVQTIRAAARTGAQGTGVGLAIVERYAQLTGGSLVLSNRNPGLAARLSLPLATQAQPAPPLPPP